jgi:sugar phosphate isomerase/epimerase
VSPLRDAGLTVAYHNQDYEFEMLEDGSTPLNHLLTADPDLLLELDLGWAWRAGRDPVQLIEQYASRLWAVHLKDVAPFGQKREEHGWADVGTGVLPWTQIWQALNQASVPLRFVEHNGPADHWRFADQSKGMIDALEADRQVVAG